MEKVKKEVSLNAWGITNSTILDIQQKKTVLLVVSILCIGIAIPLLVQYYSVNNYYLCLSLIAFSLCLLIDVCFIYFTSKIPIHYSVVVFFLITSQLLGVDSSGIDAVFWSYPTAIALIFIIPVRAANMAISVLILGTTIILYQQVEVALILRSQIALLVLWVISNVLFKTLQRVSNDLYFLSSRDPLTGAYNRRQLGFCINNSLDNCRRSGASAALVVIDIDSFKSVNDKYGHNTGDKIIQHVSQIIYRNKRQTDLFFRVGGDEFLLLINNASQEQAFFIANKTCEAVGLANDNIKLVVTISVGICCVSADYTADIWLENADKALYLAKAEGRNRVKVYVDGNPEFKDNAKAM